MTPSWPRKLLFTEGIIKNSEEIINIDHCFIACAENKENVIQVQLKEGVVPHLQNTERNFYTTSSCGVCGKGSINAIRTVGDFTHNGDVTPGIIDGGLLYPVNCRIFYGSTRLYLPIPAVCMRRLCLIQKVNCCWFVRMLAGIMLWISLSARH